MSFWQRRSKRKVSGSKYKKQRDKKKRELGRLDILARLGQRRIKKIRIMGGKEKTKLVRDGVVNVVVGKKLKKARINGIVENKANRHYKRMEIITKGALVETDLGVVKITNRPSREGFLNGILVEKATKK